jgi:hypothetical protein
VPPFAPPRASEQLRYIVLPQATNLAIAPTVGFLVQGVKGGALTSAIGFIDLTKAGSKISNATFKPFLVYNCLAPAAGTGMKVAVHDAASLSAPPAAARRARTHRRWAPADRAIGIRRPRVERTVDMNHGCGRSGIDFDGVATSHAGSGPCIRSVRTAATTCGR